jgi:hypothetical protein
MTTRFVRFLDIATGLPALALLAALATGAHAQPAAPATAATVTSARVVEVDPASRAVMAQGAQGPVFQALAGNEAAMIGPIQAGDRLTVAQGAPTIVKLEALTTRGVALAESQEQAAHPTLGSQRGVVREVTTTATAEITEIDLATRTITIRGPRAATRKVHASDPGLDLSRLQRGQMARIVYHEATTITVDASGAAPQ